MATPQEIENWNARVKAGEMKVDPVDREGRDAGVLFRQKVKEMEKKARPKKTVPKRQNPLVALLARKMNHRSGDLAALNARIRRGELKVQPDDRERRDTGAMYRDRLLSPQSPQPDNPISAASPVQSWLSSAEFPHPTGSRISFPFYRHSLYIKGSGIYWCGNQQGIVTALSQAPNGQIKVFAECTGCSSVILARTLGGQQLI